MIACMGGNCQSRETCADYQRGYGGGEQEEKTIQLVERLCGKEEEPSQMLRLIKGAGNDLGTH